MYCLYLAQAASVVLVSRWGHGADLGATVLLHFQIRLIHFQIRLIHFQIRLIHFQLSATGGLHFQSCSAVEYCLIHLQTTAVIASHLLQLP